MVLALQVAVNQVWQQVFKDIGGILQSSLKGSHDKWGHIAAVPHGERALHFQCSDEGEQEHFVVDELAKQLQGLLHVLLAITWHLHRKKEATTVHELRLMSIKQEFV